MRKIALIFGITGQDGSYLTKFLLKKKYIVHGVKRRSSLINTQRIDDVYEDINSAKNLKLHYGDVTDSLSVGYLINKIRPDEIYNLAAQSHVSVSFETPEYTANVTALGALRILESIKNINTKKKIKYYQAGSSEMFGSTPPIQNEKSKFNPVSPYGTSKLYAHWITTNYRDAYGIFACNGILFNHESPKRGETFVTKKIVAGLVNVLQNKTNKIYLGNLYAKRDWGHAKDYVEAMWLMMQQKNADDFVIATGKQYSVKEFITEVVNQLNMKIIWKGKGIREKAFFDGKCIIEISKRYFRPLEVDSLMGDFKKAQKKLKWRPKYNLRSLVKEMIEEELKN
tara:strand:- start:1728 stop:2747 length:1020 start_codon:yes stop_codon:yes gene_type:complete